MQLSGIIDFVAFRKYKRQYGPPCDWILCADYLLLWLQTVLLIWDLFLWSTFSVLFLRFDCKLQLLLHKPALSNPTNKPHPSTSPVDWSSLTKITTTTNEWMNESQSLYLNPIKLKSLCFNISMVIYCILIQSSKRNLTRSGKSIEFFISVNNSWWVLLLLLLLLLNTISIQCIFWNQ